MPLTGVEHNKYEGGTAVVGDTLRLVREPHYPLQLATQIGVSQQAVTKQLGELEKAGMIQSEKVQDGGVQIVEVHAVFDGLYAMPIGLSSG